MSSSLSKRHQARNERALQDLIKSGPGNDRCADCNTRNPGWASWSLGIFLCMRCAAIHRKLGTHISKVKSLSMDSWSSDQVENMRKVGNLISNKIFNPHNTKPKVPLDVDEVDSAMERFIRAKYEQKAYAEGAAPVRSTTVSSYANNPVEEDKPPTPPPKPGKKFGFGLRSSSSALNLSRNKDKDSSRKTSARGKIFGATIGVTDEGMQWKLVTLREMGFPDEQRNTSVLKGHNGDLERAVESLVRLGEGVPGSPSAIVKSPQSSQFSSGVHTPTFPDSKAQEPNIGASAEKANTQPSTPATTAPSTQLPSNVQSLSSPSSPRSYNPFENIQQAAPQQQQSLNGAMQSLNLGGQTHAQPQTLFPNTTGGYPNSQDQYQQMRLQQSMTPPPVPQVPQHFNYNNPYAQYNSQQQFNQQNYNPYLNSIQQQVAAQPVSNPFLNQGSDSGASNIFFNPGTNNICSVISQSVPSTQQSTQQGFQPPQQQPVPHPWMSQPIQNSPTHFNQSQYFPAVNQSQMQGSMTYPNSYQQPQNLQPQQTGRIDKSAILALYNYPQLAPQQAAEQPEQPSAQESSPQPQPAKTPSAVAPTQRSATMPVSGSKNPFARPGIPDMTPAAGASNPRNSIVSGRHSPDAFASLSARFVR